MAMRLHLNDHMGEDLRLPQYEFARFAIETDQGAVQAHPRV